MLILRNLLNLKDILFVFFSNFAFIILYFFILKQFYFGNSLWENKKIKDDVDENLASITEAI